MPQLRRKRCSTTPSTVAALVVLVWIGMAPTTATRFHAYGRPAGAGPTPSGTSVIPKGDRFSIRLQNNLDTVKVQPGQSVDFRLVHDLYLGDMSRLPKDLLIRATVTAAHRRRLITVMDRPRLRLRLDELILSNGDSIPLPARIVRAGFLQVRGAGTEAELLGRGFFRGAALIAAGGAVRGTMMAGPLGGLVGAATYLVTLNGTRERDLRLDRGSVLEGVLLEDLHIPGAPTLVWHPPRAARLSHWERPTQHSERESQGVRSESPTFPEGTLARDDSVTEPAPAGEPRLPGGDFTLKVHVDLVTVEAVARDLRGKSVQDLGPTDFILLDNQVRQQITHFSQNQLPLAVALVLDRSASVRPYMIELRSVAARILQLLKSVDKIALFGFAESTERMVDLTHDRNKITDKISILEASGNTNVYDALFDATHYLSVSAPHMRKVLVFVSDNRPNMMGRSNESGVIRRALEAEVVIYGIQAGPEPPDRPASIPGSTPGPPLWTHDPNSIRRIVEATGGELFTSADPVALSETLMEVISRLKLRYTLGFSPKPSLRDGAFHELSITLAGDRGAAGKDYEIRARRGYYARRASQ